MEAQRGLKAHTARIAAVICLTPKPVPFTLWLAGISHFCKS